MTFRRASFFVLFTAASLACGCSSLPRTSERQLANGRRARADGDLESALTALSEAISSAGELSLFYTEALLERGDLYLEIWETRREAPETERLELLANAQADFQAVATWDQPGPLDRARALEGQGRVHLRRGAPEEAMRVFREALAIREGEGIEPDDPLRAVRLSVHRQLGWVILNESLHRLPLETAPDAAELDVLREAQEQFFAGLEIERDDPLCNLGRGICLHLRGQSDLAIPHLERYLAGTGALDPRGFFFLARAIETASGLHRDAIGLYARAIAIEPPRDFFPLYRHRYTRGKDVEPSRVFLDHYIHLATVLPSYLEPDAPRYRDFLRHLLAFETSSPEYWDRIALVAKGLVEDDSAEDSVRELGRFGLALAAARSGRTKEAVEWLVGLAGRLDFEVSLDRVFPGGRGARPRDVLGRALVLHQIGRGEELETWFRTSGVEASLLESVRTDPAARRALTLRAQNLLELYERRPAGSSPALEGGTGGEAPSPLIIARTAFEASVYNEDDPEAKVEAQLGLAKTLEYLGSFGEALSKYEALIQSRPTDEIYRNIQRLHRSANLKEEERAQAWALLRDYSGSDTEIQTYVQKLRSALVGRFCPGCGHRNASARRYCIECGRRLAPEQAKNP